MIILISLFALAACSSTPKEEEAPAPAPAVSEEPAPTTTETPADSEDKMVADAGGTMTGDFPDVEGTERNGATCKMGSDERMVSVIDTSEGPCGVVYTKHSNKRTVAYAKHEMAFCDRVYENIVGNLTKGGFDCGGPAAAAEPTPAEENKAEEASEAQAE